MLAAAMIAAGLAACSSSDSTGDDAPGSGNPGSSALAVDSGSCSSEGGATEAGADAGTTPTDGSASDVTTTTDATNGDGTTAETSGPEVTSAVASSGTITIWPDALFAYFFEDNTILHFQSAPECVVHIRSATKGFSSAGDLRVGGDFCGQDGGPAAGGITYQPGVAPMATPNAYEEFLEPPTLFYPETGALNVLLQTTGTSTVPAMPVQTLKSPAFTSVQVLSPTVPLTGALTIPHAQPFVVTWNVPGGITAGQRMVVSISSIATDSHVADIRCGATITAGRAEIPAVVLGEVWSRLGVTAASLNGAFLRILAGDQREVVVGTASYVIEMGRHDGTTFGDEVQVVMQ